jgi:excisionase family DNA binding protein
MKGEDMKRECATAPDFRTPASSVRVLLRPEEGAEAAGVSRSQFFKYLADGSIRSIKVGRLRRIPVSEIEAWVARQLEQQ